MKYLSLRMWFIVTVTFALGAVIIRLIWETFYDTPAGTLSVIIMTILAVLSFHALLVYLALKPNWKKLIGLPFEIFVMLMTTAGLVGSIIHFSRFVVSPEVDSLLSLTIAILLLIATISAYFLLLWGIWSIWKVRKKLVFDTSQTVVSFRLMKGIAHEPSKI